MADGSSVIQTIETMPYAHVMRSYWSVGVDIGQSNDPTAMAAVERLSWYATINYKPGLRLMPGLTAFPIAALDATKPRDALHVRELKRLQLGITYIEIAQQIAALLGDAQLSNAKVFIDATGVGKPIVDLFKHAGIAHTPVWITSGRDEATHGDGISVPKLILISRLQAALHSGELKIAKALPESLAFMRELQEFRATFTEIGNIRFGARQGAHDDLVIAAALAVYGATAKQYAMTINLPILASSTR
ncbi:MAG: hypothetical protein ABUS47_16485 [Steroidobacter sp.]